MAGFHRWLWGNSVRSGQIIERFYLGPFGKHKLARDDSPQVILYKSNITYEIVSEVQNLGRDVAKPVS